MSSPHERNIIVQASWLADITLTSTRGGDVLEKCTPVSHAATTGTGTGTLSLGKWPSGNGMVICLMIWCSTRLSNTCRVVEIWIENGSFWYFGLAYLCIGEFACPREDVGMVGCYPVSFQTVFRWVSTATNNKGQNTHSSITDVGPKGTFMWKESVSTLPTSMLNFRSDAGCTLILLSPTINIGFERLLSPAASATSADVFPTAKISGNCTVL